MDYLNRQLVATSASRIQIRQMLVEEKLFLSVLTAQVSKSSQEKWWQQRFNAAIFFSTNKKCHWHQLMLLELIATQSYPLNLVATYGSADELIDYKLNQNRNLEEIKKKKNWNKISVNCTNLIHFFKFAEENRFYYRYSYYFMNTDFHWEKKSKNTDFQRMKSFFRSHKQ